jgi:hypothetical protein
MLSMEAFRDYSYEDAMKTSTQLGQQKRIRRPSPAYRANARDIALIGDAANMLRRLGAGAEPLQIARELARSQVTRLTEVLNNMTEGS